MRENMDFRLERFLDKWSAHSGLPLLFFDMGGCRVQCCRRAVGGVSFFFFTLEDYGCPLGLQAVANWANVCVSREGLARGLARLGPLAVSICAEPAPPVSFANVFDNSRPDQAGSHGTPFLFWI